MSIFGSAFGNQGISFSRAMTARQRLCSHMTPPQPFWVHRLANIYLRMNWPVFPNFPRDSSCPLLLTHTHHQSILRYFHFICLFFFLLAQILSTCRENENEKKALKYLHRLLIPLPIFPSYFWICLTFGRACGKEESPGIWGKTAGDMPETNIDINAY